MWMAQGLTFLIPVHIRLSTSARVPDTISIFRSSSFQSLIVDFGKFSISLVILLVAGTAQSPSVIMSLFRLFLMNRMTLVLAHGASGELGIATPCNYSATSAHFEGIPVSSRSGCSTLRRSPGFAARNRGEILPTC